MSIGAEATARNHQCMLAGELSRSLISRAQQLLCLSGSAKANLENLNIIQVSQEARIYILHLGQK